MSDYVPDPIKLMEMRAERMMESHFRPGEFLCGMCDKWFAESFGMTTASPDPSSPPICWQCFEEASK